METQEKKKLKPRGRPFQVNNPGKPVGAVNKFPKTVKEGFAEVFNHLQNDENAKSKRADLKSWAEDNPTEFYRQSTKLIPVQITGDPDNPVAVNVTSGLTFEQLYQLKYGTKPE